MKNIFSKSDNAALCILNGAIWLALALNWLLPHPGNRVVITLWILGIGAAAATSLLVISERGCERIRIRKPAAFKMLLTVLAVYAVFLALKVTDRLLPIFNDETSWSLGPYRNTRGVGKGYDMHRMRLYPYTGFHAPANFHHQGRMNNEKNPWYSDFDVQSGDHGFFVDFDLENPPAKATNEIRIILIGGSAAQGYGAQSNERMFYRLLEKQLSKALEPRGLWVRVINLAMIHSCTYDNFLALNRWGHSLSPDLIVSFSGYNDIETPQEQKGLYLPLRFETVFGLTRAIDTSETPGFLKDVAEVFPNLNASMPATLLRLSRVPQIGRRAHAEYLAAEQTAGYNIQNHAWDQYFHALQSIKRDFQGIPILVALQPFRTHTWRLEQTRQRLSPTLKDYINSKWCFVDVDAIFSLHNFKTPEYMIVVHLTNKGHLVVADILTEQTLQFMNTLGLTKSVAARTPLPAQKTPTQGNRLSVAAATTR